MSHWEIRASGASGNQHSPWRSSPDAADIRRPAPRCPDPSTAASNQAGSDGSKGSGWPRDENERRAVLVLFGDHSRRGVKEEAVRFELTRTEIMLVVETRIVPSR